MKQVWKFPVPVGGRVTHAAPWFHNKVIYVATDEKTGTVCVWAEVLADCPRNEWFDKTFVIVGTGHPVPENAVHRGSAQVGPFVWHVYEENAA